MNRMWKITQTGFDIEFFCFPEDILGEDKVETSWSRTLAQIEDKTKLLNDKFLHKEKSIGITNLADDLLILAAQLKIHAEARLVEIAQDRIKYAPHPSFPAN